MQAELHALLGQYTSAYAIEQEFLRQTQDFVARHTDCCSRLNLAGHITASAWVLHPDKQAVLLTHHKKLHRWLQLGGHVDDDLSIQAAALREAQEESGLPALQLVSPDIFDLDVHAIPARANEPSHWHYDLRFLMQASSHEFIVSEESHQLAWLPLDHLRDLARGGQLEASLQRMVDKTFAWLAGTSR